MSDFLLALVLLVALLWNVSGRLPYQKVVDVIVVGRVAFSFPLAVVSVADLSRQKKSTKNGQSSSNFVNYS